MDNKGIWEDRNPNQSVSWFLGKWCSVSSSEHLVVTDINEVFHLSQLGNQLCGCDVLCCPVPMLTSSGDARPRRTLLLLGFWVSAAILCPNGRAAVF